MQNRLKIALVVAVFFGLIAAYGIYNFLSERQKTEDTLRAANQERPRYQPVHFRRSSKSSAK